MGKLDPAGGGVWASPAAGSSAIEQVVTRVRTTDLTSFLSAGEGVRSSIGSPRRFVFCGDKGKAVGQREAVRCPRNGSALRDPLTDRAGGRLEWTYWSPEGFATRERLPAQLPAIY